MSRCRKYRRRLRKEITHIPTHRCSSGAPAAGSDSHPSAQRQRTNADLYAESRLDQAVYEKTLFEWGHPAVARYCRRHGFAYPALDDDGEIAGPFTDISGKEI